MADTVFRTAQDVAPKEQAPTPEAKPDTQRGSEVEVDDLMFTYAEETGRPYVSDYFEIADTWDKTSIKDEIQKIETHIKEKVTKRELANTTKAAQKYLKTLEKKAEVDAVMDSTNSRIDKLSAYIDFLEVVNG